MNSGPKPLREALEPPMTKWIRAMTDIGMTRIRMDAVVRTVD